MTVPAVSIPSERKSLCDLTVDYLKDASNGTAHLFSTIETAAKFFPETPSVEKVRTYAGIAGSALCIPQFVEQVRDLNTHFTDLRDAIGLPESDTERTQKISKAAKKSITTVIDTTATSCEFALFTNEIVPLGEAAPAVEGIFQVACAISDGVDFFDQIYKIGKYCNLLETTTVDEQKNYYRHKIYRTIIQLAKDVFSVAIATIALLSLFFSAFFQGIVFIPPLVLGLSSLYVLTKIVSYFYQMILKEEKKQIFS